MKLRVTHESLATWSHFRDFLVRDLWQDQPPVRGRFMYRGQADAEWSLESSFDRTFSRGSKPNDELEQLLLDNFRRECESESELKDLVANKDRLTALAQHSGVPTRLLDWSDSPYIAAFFAFQGYLMRSSRVAIWVLDTSSRIWSERYGVQVLSIPSWQNTRMRTQAGFFTLSKVPFATLEEYVERFDADGGESNPLLKISLPGTEARMALADLDLMNLHHGALLGGLEGKAKTALSKAVLASVTTS